MDLKGILSIAGAPGLFKLVSQTRNGIIVESLVDKTRRQAFATSKISSLEDIAIYTSEEDLPLAEVLKSIFKRENGGQCSAPKASSEEMKKYFESVLPNYDKEKVYVSDIKRVLNWYNLLHQHNLVDLEDKVETVEEVKQEPEPEK